MPNWSDVLDEIRDKELNRSISEVSGLDIVRRHYVAELSNLTGRNAICYYSGWLSKPYAFGMDIGDADRNAFMMMVNGMDRTKGLDLILHTPGGDIAAAESIVYYLRQMFGANVRAIVPQIAMSAGTMIACSCYTIIMAKHSNLGPIHPQLNGVPAAAVRDEFETAIREISHDPTRLAGWQFILGKYTPTYLSACENAVEWSKDFVEKALKENMFIDDDDRDAKAAAIVRHLSDYSGNRAHSRHIHADECQRIQLNITELEADAALQDAVLTVHHAFMHTIANSSAVKIVENNLGKAFITNGSFN